MPACQRCNSGSKALEQAAAIGDKTEAAYRRGELMKKRAAMMQAWATFATTPRKAGNVVAMSRATAAA